LTEVDVLDFQWLEGAWLALDQSNGYPHCIEWVEFRIWIHQFKRAMNEIVEQLDGRKPGLLDVKDPNQDWPGCNIRHRNLTGTSQEEFSRDPVMPGP
jgi:hypothetical protein